MQSDTAAPARNKVAAPALKLPELKPDQAIVDATRLLATNLVIKTPEGYERAAKQLVDLKEEITRIENDKDSVFKPINAGLRAFSALVAKALDPLKQYEISIKRAMIAYSDEQDRLRQEEQRRANEVARKEQERLQEIADRAATKARLEAEEKRRQAVQAEKAGNEAEAERLRAQADRVEEKAADKIESFESRASQVVAPVAQQAAPRVAGVSIPKVWVFEITDEDVIPREYLIVDETRIRRVVTALKGDTKIPGVRVFEQKRIAAGVA